ncbi:DNA recombination protein RmuC [Alteromonas sp. ASW11-130]|uniref:DNA recombination protein RmuC n=1 Tax=Alteromonas sp. ASW11-130 TaxID=3015775 RepID=UPI002241A270|nr:DNA recombination protein RmuC [Alteromonas sp. ASW11-130]MCW8092274.1 DNA recombination protein RmuC [Alteromonas sp. ASW11-130]
MEYLAVMYLETIPALALVTAAIILSFIFGWLLGQRKQSKATQNALAENAILQHQLSQSQAESSHVIHKLEDELNAHREQIYHSRTRMGELIAKAEQLEQTQERLSRLQHELDESKRENAELNGRYEAKAARLTEIEKAHVEKLQVMEQAEHRLQTQFENLANKIFEQKSQNFSQLNASGLTAILTPLREQIDGFKKQVSDQYIREGQERASLKTEIHTLKELNQRITEEAAALTQALKGDNKKQGNWGEVVLERILTESGLRQGHEFDIQVSARNEAGKLQQPDVVVHLPNNKDVIIDSKVSLSAYERFYNATDEIDRKRLLTEHVNSIRGHIKGLGAKDYQHIQSLKTLDYVLMFIPIEPAFLLAIEEEPNLVNLALSHNIMLVSPTNLLVALRTINNIWQYEYQNQNAQKIAQHATKLYDKFVGFIGDMEKIGKSLETTQKHYEGAFNKLSQGRGNMVRQIEHFRLLGVQSSKRLANELVADELDSEADKL